MVIITYSLQAKLQNFPTVACRTFPKSFEFRKNTLKEPVESIRKWEANAILKKLQLQQHPC